jgi:hypothetical protein
MCAKRQPRHSEPSGNEGQFDVRLTANKQVFTFPLHSRVLDLGSNVKITHYWIDQRLLKETPNNRSQNLCRRIVDHWEQVLFELDPSGAHSPSEELALAHLYRVLSRRKRMHQVFRDACLRPLPRRRRGQEEVRRSDLPDHVLERINLAVNQQDNDAIRRECALIFDWEPSSPQELRFLNQLYDQWIHRAVSLYRDNPNTGIDQFVEEFCAAETRGRRSSRTSPISRRFFDLLMFETKVCFYQCYAVLWQRLIPWLQNNRGLDPVNEQFLRFWHNQNPSLRRSARQGDSTSFETDVFFGHVISLHPLSGLLMSTPHLWELTSKYFRDARSARLTPAQTAASTAYRDVVRAILMAGHIYRLNDTRNPYAAIRESSGSYLVESASSATHGADMGAVPSISMQESLARLARLTGLACQQCRSQLTNFHCTEIESNQATLTGLCATCNIASACELDVSEFNDRLLPPGQD